MSHFSLYCPAVHNSSKQFGSYSAEKMFGDYNAQQVADGLMLICQDSYVNMTYKHCKLGQNATPLSEA